MEAISLASDVVVVVVVADLALAAREPDFWHSLALWPLPPQNIHKLLKFPVPTVLLSFVLSTDAPSTHYIITLVLLVDVFLFFHTSVFIAEVLR